MKDFPFLHHWYNKFSYVCLGDKEQGESKQSRAERKTKKAMQKLGLAQVEGINRVVLRKDKSLLFVVPNPEVFRRGDTWVVLGEARVEDPGQRAREMAAQNMAQKEVQKEKVRILFINLNVLELFFGETMNSTIMRAKFPIREKL